MIAPLKAVKYREYRAQCVLMTLVCGHSVSAHNDASGLHRCAECTT